MTISFLLRCCFPAILISALVLISCGSECDRMIVIPQSVNNQVAMQNEVEIQNYLQANMMTAEKTDNGVYYIINKAGEGMGPELCDEVTVLYTGYLTDGTVFDTSGSTPISFALYNVITGWQEGIPLFGKGGEGTLLIPSRLAYGPNSPSPDIPANSVLIFDVTLVDY